MHVVRLGSASEGERPAETMAVYGQRTVVAPREYTKLLGLTSDEPVAERIVTVTADDQTLLASISYVPVALVDDSADWQDAGIGNLALTGHAVTPTGRLQSRSRLPTAAEKDVLNIPIEEEIPVSILSQPYHVQFGDRRMAAGVIVLTRGDQVVLRWNAQSAGRLTLRMNEE